MVGRPVRSVPQYLETIWNTKPPKSTHVKLYRGQAHDQRLLPRLFRPPKGVALDDLAWITRVRTVEPRLLDDFKNESPYLLPSKPDNDWDWLSLGQHFQLPTRLLDWTANPLTALFFAVEGDNTTAPVVYLYHASSGQIVTAKERSTASPFRIAKTRILQPSWHSIRVAMQAGWHTVHRIHHKGDLKANPEEVRPLDEMHYHDKRIIKIEIDQTSSAKLRSELADMGIKHATVYGDLQAVSTSIRTRLGVV